VAYADPADARIADLEAQLSAALAQLARTQRERDAYLDQLLRAPRRVRGEEPLG
jgi:hypothetical protein